MTITSIDDVKVIRGVDTHRDTHMVAALDQRGAQLGVREFTTTPAGHHAALNWFESFGAIEQVGVEGAGTYGAGLTRVTRRMGAVVATRGVSGGCSPGPAVRAEFEDGRVVVIKAAGTALNEQSP